MSARHGGSTWREGWRPKACRGGNRGPPLRYGDLGRQFGGEIAEGLIEVGTWRLKRFGPRSL